MAAMIGLVWLGCTVYAVIGLMRPLRPFKRKWHAGLALVWVQLIAAFAISPFVPGQVTADDAAQTKSAQQVATPAPPPKPQEFELVRVDPNAPDEPPSAASAADAKQAREEMRQHLRLIEAAQSVLLAGFQARDPSAVELVRRDMSKMSVALTQRRPPFASPQWPARDTDGHIACGTAAQRLSVMASSALQEQSLEEAAARSQFAEDYDKAIAACRKWVASA